MQENQLYQMRPFPGLILAPTRSYGRFLDKLTFFDIFKNPRTQNHIPSGTSQTSLMPPIDRSRRDLSIGGIRLVWEVQEHT